MQNRYTAPHLSLYAVGEDVLMLSSNLGGGTNGGNNSGSIELPPIPMRADTYAPPSVSIEDAPTDILMDSVNQGGSGGGVGDLLEGSSWGGNTGIEMPPMPMG